MNEHKFYRQKYSIKDYSSQWFPWDSVKMVRFGGHFILSNPSEFEDPIKLDLRSDLDSDPLDPKMPDHKSQIRRKFTAALMCSF